MLLQLIASFSIYAFTISAFAADPINPMTLCDRFLAKEEIKECEFRIKATRPDWYLAGACQHQFDNEAFFECLSLSRGNTFDPVEMQKCSGPDMNDAERMNCVQSIAKVSEPKYEKPDRAPASKKSGRKKPLKSAASSKSTKATKSSKTLKSPKKAGAKKTSAPKSSDKATAEH